MGLSVQSARRFAPTLVLTFVILVSVFLALRQALGASSVGTIDLLQYYSAAKLWLAGQDPYNPSLIESVERSVSANPAIPVLMWNPPQILPIIAPLALLKFSDAVAAWILLAVLSIAVSIKICMNLFCGNNSRARKISQVVLLCTFYPFALCVGYGQISFLLLLSLSIFLMRVSSGRRDLAGDYLAGLALSFITIKPHLLYLVFVLLVIRSFRTRSWQTIFGLVAGLLILVALATMITPSVLVWYQHAVAAAPPIYWQTPTMGSWLQGVSEIHFAWIRILPSALFAAGAILIFSRLDKRALNTDLLIAIVPLSLVSSPYGWTYDHMLMLPAMFWLIKEAKFAPLAALLVALNVMVCVTPPHWGQQSMVWYPAAVAALTLLHFFRYNYAVAVPGSSGSSNKI